jgi:MPBQ/MSBQ methyltransferase
VQCEKEDSYITLTNSFEVMDTTSKVIEISTTSRRIKQFYERATDDYQHWSKGFNMHFGYWSKGTNPLDREKMLNAMNDLIIEKTGDGIRAGNFLDLGCGVGATVNYANSHFPQHKFQGVTLSPYQVQLGRTLFGENVQISEGDFSDTNLPGATFDGAWFLESLCHAADKNKTIQEAARLLKLGGRLVIADGMLMKQAEKLRFPAKQLNKSVSGNWEVPEFTPYKYLIKILLENGFEIEKIEDFSYKIAPSVFHAPFLSLKHLFINSLRKRHVDPCQTANLKASLAAIFLGACRHAFRYYIITARKRK